MTPDDAHTSHSHGFELPDAPPLVVHKDPRPWRAVASVADCLGLAGIVAGLIVAHRQSVSDEQLTSDALQREELRDGWRTLGAAAALDAQNNGNQVNAAAATATAPLPNVVIVNVPAPSAPSAPAAPANVTTVNVPSDSLMGSNTAPVESSNTRTAPVESQNTSPGYAANQSLPAINYSPVPGYVPTPNPTSPSPQTNYLPQDGYGTTGGVPPLAPAVGNGSIPGSTPNPALPNNGLVGSAPVPGLPSGSRP